jgi:hypothetical protein
VRRMGMKMLHFPPLFPNTIRSTNLKKESC